MNFNDAFEDLIAGLDIHTVQTYSLVLSAANIRHQCVKEDAGWCIRVGSQEIPAAKQQIESYLQENPLLQDAVFPHHSETIKNYSMVWIAVVLIAFHWAAGSGSAKAVLTKRFGASSEGILNGEIFRCLTALMLHGDAAHLASNIAALLLFGTILCRTVGTGTAWILILCGGVGGNLLNAFLHRAAHLSIGASTAVFSTLGSLSAISFLMKIDNSGSKIKAILPLGGGIALLTFLGSDPATDILAHLFGFISGFMITFLWLRVFPKKFPALIQWILSALSAVIVGLAWITGIYFQ